MVDDSAAAYVKATGDMALAHRRVSAGIYLILDLCLVTPVRYVPNAVGS